MTSIPLADLLRDLSTHDLAVLEKRARELAHHTQETENIVTIPALSFRLAGETYAILADYVREVRPLKRLTRVPFAPDFVVGVINLRGNILSLIDIRKFLGISSPQLADMLVMIVIEAEGLELAILAQKVHEVILLPTHNLTQPPATIGAAEAEFIDGITPDGTILLNFQRILNDPRLIVRAE